MRDFLPDSYREMSDTQLKDRIAKIKSELGKLLVILVHHYQRADVAAFGDFKGDSYGLSKRAAEQADAKYIVFCGVHFMAESAAILARPDQAVFTPAVEAGCPMSDMAPVDKVERAWAEFVKIAGEDSATPITYVNSSAAVKAFCGARGGATCTSSNADKLFAWAIKEREKIFFMPDEHLGRNSAHKLGIGPVALWDRDRENGGLAADEVRQARVIVWKGFCHVHTHFTVEHIKEKRAEFPGCKVVVHPECPREVVAAADHSGSTEGIIKFVDGQPDGSVIVVGTEINLVRRLEVELEGRKKIVPLTRSLCPNMFKINLHNLCWVLDCIAAGENKWVNRVTVTDGVRRDAGKALKRMLEIAG